MKGNLLLFSTLGLLLASCGSENSLNTNNNGSLSSGGTLSDGSQIYCEETASALNSLASKINCPYNMTGESRKVVSFFSQNLVNNNTISRPFQKGNPGNAGCASDQYVGINYDYGDIMVIEKLMNNNQVMGYNVTVSFCPQYFRDSWGQSVPLIGSNRGISSFDAPQGIIVNSSGACGKGNATATTYVYIDQFQSQRVSYPAQWLPTYFAPLQNCY